MNIIIRQLMHFGFMHQEQVLVKRLGMSNLFLEVIKITVFIGQIVECVKNFTRQIKENML